MRQVGLSEVVVNRLKCVPIVAGKGLSGMERELAFVMITPHTLAKSRTGGVLARYLARTDLKFVAARMFNPSAELTQQYAESFRTATEGNADVNNLLAAYVEENFNKHAKTGQASRVMMLLFEGPDAVAKIWGVTGAARMRSGYGETVRETFGEYIENDDGSVRYFEPGVIVAPTVERAKQTLNIWKRYAASDGGLVESSLSRAEGDVQRTLVMLKPDNFQIPSLRTGSIIDVLSRSGLRIICANKFKMTVAQAESFYGPVKGALSQKFPDIGKERAAKVLSETFDFDVPVEICEELCARLGDTFAATQFEDIVEFMTGHRPSEVPEDEKETTGSAECLALVYEGVNAVSIIRDILGPTNPSKAEPGSVRREFGSNIMVNAAHASDSPENAQREMDIIKVTEDNITPWIEKYC